MTARVIDLAEAREARAAVLRASFERRHGLTEAVYSQLAATLVEAYFDEKRRAGLVFVRDGQPCVRDGGQRGND